MHADTQTVLVVIIRVIRSYMLLIQLDWCIMSGGLWLGLTSKPRVIRSYMLLIQLDCILTHCNYSQPASIKLDNENIGGHCYTFTTVTGTHFKPRAICSYMLLIQVDWCIMSGGLWLGLTSNLERYVAICYWYRWTGVSWVGDCDWDSLQSLERYVATICYWYRWTGVSWVGDCDWDSLQSLERYVAICYWYRYTGVSWVGDCDWDSLQSRHVGGGIRPWIYSVGSSICTRWHSVQYTGLCHAVQLVLYL